MEKLFKRFCVFLSAVLVVSSVSMVFAMPAHAKSNKKFDFFSSNQLIDNIQNLEVNLTSVIYVQNSSGQWEEYQRIHGHENRIWVGNDQIPQTLKDAFISIEDERFYEHKGVDWKRTAAAMGNELFGYYSSKQGGSTITQQLIKNITGDKKQNAFRKMREIIRALMVEKKLDKDKILEAYLNTISLGNGICGVQVAANYYFNKDVSALTLTECAAIAAITKNPSYYEPKNHSEENRERRNVVLDKMLELGKISAEEHDAAVNSDIALDFSQQENYEVEINSYFVDTLIDEVIGDLAEKYNCSEDIASTMLYNGGYKIYSTVNPKIQSVMEDVYLNVDKYFKQKDSTGAHVQSAMTVMDYSGHILGVVGGAGEKTVNRGLNRAVDSPRQPGSTMKPIGVYALAIENEIANYSTMVPDKPIENYYGKGKSGPKEWYGYYKGNITVQYALEKSANTIPVRLLQDVGIENSYDFLTNKLQCRHLTEVDKNLASLALGGCQYGITTTESAASYAVFGNQGKYYAPTTYYKIENANKEIVLESPTEGTQVISPATATVMNRLLQNVVYGGEGTGKGIAGYSSMKAYAKTGTSSESNDLWMVAGTPYYVGSVWYGFDQPSAVKNGGAAATVWKTVMEQVHRNLKKIEFQYSEDVYSAKYCTATGKLAADGCPSDTGYYKKGSQVGKCDGSHGNTVAETEPSSSESAETAPASSSASSETSSAVSSETGSSSSSVQSSSSESSSNTESEPDTGGSSSQPSP